MAKWLLVSPVFDEVTEYCYDESRDALDYMKDKVEIIGDLSGRNVKREEVEKILETDPDVNLAFWNHGSEDALWGSKDEAVINLDNIEILSGREVFTSACSFGAKGGVEAWKKKAKAVLAYTDVVIFTTDSLEEFTEAFNYPIKRRVDGLSWKECLEKTKAKMIELRDKLIKAGKALAAACMTRDHDILVCYNTEPPSSDCRVRRLAIRAFGPKIGWRLSKKFTISIALIILLLFIACQLHGVGGDQMDMMYWDVIPDAKQNEYWIPEFQITYRNAFIMFWLMNYTGFTLVVILLVLTLAYTVYKYVKTP